MFLCPWDSLGNNTGMCFHTLLQSLPDPGIEMASLTSPALAGGFFATSASWGIPDRGPQVLNFYSNFWHFWIYHFDLI